MTDAKIPAVVETWADLFSHLAGQIDIVGVIFSAILIFFFIVAWRWQNNEAVVFDIRDIIMVGGHVSADRIKELGAFFATTFILIREEFNGTLSEWLFTAYSGIWVLKGLASIWKGVPLPDKETDAKP